jgi:hypothetical protein
VIEVHNSSSEDGGEDGGDDDMKSVPDSCSQSPRPSSTKNRKGNAPAAAASALASAAASAAPAASASASASAAAERLPKTKAWFEEQIEKKAHHHADPVFQAESSWEELDQNERSRVAALKMAADLEKRRLADLQKWFKDVSGIESHWADNTIRIPKKRWEDLTPDEMNEVVAIKMQYECSEELSMTRSCKKKRA